MTCIKKCKTSFKNDVEESESFYVGLNGGSEVGKSFLINAIT